MKEFKCGKNLYCIAKPHGYSKNLPSARAAPTELANHLDNIFEKSEAFQEYLRIFGELSDLKDKETSLKDKGTAYIAANGRIDASGKKPIWLYQDDKKEFSVQSLVDRLDGKYLGIVLDISEVLKNIDLSPEDIVGNPFPVYVRPRKSVLVLLDSSHKVNALIPPGAKQEIDSSTIEYELGQLQKEYEIKKS